MRLEGIVLKLPHTIRNISTKMTLSNSFMISNNNTYAVAGVRYFEPTFIITYFVYVIRYWIGQSY